MTWLFTILSVAGAACNAGGSRRGLVIGYRLWVVANALWVGSFAWRGLWAEAALFAVYFVLAIYGLKKWSSQ